MKKIPAFAFLLFVVVSVYMHCSAMNIDPILIDEPNENVFECSKDMFIEIPQTAYISYTVGNVKADGFFLFVKAEVLYLYDDVWNGIDKSSFLLKHENKDGSVDVFPLNYIMTARESLVNEWPTMSEPLFFGWLLPMNLIFDVSSMDKDGWTLLFQPAERGGTAVCNVEVPIKVR